jgi:peptide/nickel transport system substrate-binding protein
MKQFTRFLGMGIVCLVMLTLIVGAASAQDGDVMVIAWEQEPPTLYPMSDMAFAAMLEHFYARGVWEWDYNLNIYPIMVTEIPSLENGMVTELEDGRTQVTYHLREGMKWSDGEPITARDCEFYHRVWSDRSASANVQRDSYPEDVESFELVDDYTFTLTYQRAFPDYLTVSYNDCRYPRHILEPILEAEGTLDNATYFQGNGVVGYGPYTFDEWIVGDTMTLNANPNWDGTPPAIERVIIKQIPDASQMQSALETGEVDLTFNWADNLLPDYQSIPGAVTFKTPGVFIDAVWINVLDGHPALQDVRVRQAIGYAMDRPAMAEGLVGPDITIPKSWYNPRWHPEDLPDALPYDPDMANQLLDEAGWVDSDGDGVRDKDGVNLILRFFTTTRQVRMDYQVLIQEYLSAVGVGTQLLPVPAGIMFDTYANRGITGHRDFDLALFAFSNDPLSPNAPTDTFTCSGIASPDNPNGGNYMGWCDEEYDELNTLVGSTVDPEERAGYYHDAVRRFTEAYFWHGLYVRDTWYAVNGERFDPASIEPNLGTLSSNYFNHVELFQPAG